MVNASEAAGRMVRAAHGFFVARVSPDVGLVVFRGASQKGVDYVNVPRIIGALVSSRMATMHELQTVYGVKDAYDLLEVLSVDNANKAASDANNS